MLDELMAAVAGVGCQLLDWRTSGGGAGHWEGAQFKAEADSRAHAAMSQALHRLEPGLPIVSEEDPASLQGDRPPAYWMIDPVDGTASYAGGYEGFVTQAALVDESGPRVAAVCAPALGLHYCAERGCGALVNGRAVRIGPTPSGVLVDNYPEPRGITAELYVALGFARYLESGSIGLKICRVADGSADVFFKAVLVRDWDLAAPHLVLAEAGGCLADRKGRPFDYRGGFEREGLIAARDEVALRRVAEWYARRAPRAGM